MSTLRQGQGYIPLHGSFWSTVLGGRITDRNPFNICLDKLKMVADKCHVVHTFEEDRQLNKTIHLFTKLYFMHDICLHEGKMGIYGITDL